MPYPHFFDDGHDGTRLTELKSMTFSSWFVGPDCAFNLAFLQALNDAGRQLANRADAAPFLSLHDQPDSAEEARQHGA